MKKNQIYISSVLCFFLAGLFVFLSFGRNYQLSDSQIELSKLNPVIVRNLLLHVFSRDQKVLCFPLNEANVGCWVKLRADEGQIKLLLQDIKRSADPKLYLENLSKDGDIKPFIQFSPPELVRFGWSNKTFRTSGNFKDHGVYLFYDEKSKILLLNIFK